MSRRIKKYVDDYIVYQISKPSYELPAGLLHPIQTNEPFHILVMDFITGLPITIKGLDVLLTIIDKFSKAIKLIAYKTMISAEETTAFYIE
jgi:hypothetical protein